AEVTRHLDQFRFDMAANALYEFIWNQYCDWYLELSKPVLWDAAQGSASVAEGRTPAATESAHERRQRGTRRTLVRVLETALGRGHPSPGSVPIRHGGQRPVRVHLEPVLRLVPGAVQAGTVGRCTGKCECR